MEVDEYPDAQIRQELVDFFSWKPDAVLDLSVHELAAWKRHGVALRHVGFWHTASGTQLKGSGRKTGVGWPS